MIRKNLTYLFLVIIILYGVSDAYSQTKVDNFKSANGFPWNQYLIYSPYYFGPNALSIPTSEKGIVKDRYEFEFKYEYHNSAGDKTHDLFLKTYIPLVKNFVALELFGVLVENYKMDSKTIYERRTFTGDGEGIAFGDLYFATIIQILRNKKFPDLALRLTCRTASGNKLRDARFTDAPGYYFDLSFGKDLNFEEKYVHKIRFHGMIGFYVWQMNMTSNQQNDAVLFGFGVDVNTKYISISSTVDGYCGYMGDSEVIPIADDESVMFRDRPIIYELKLRKPGRICDVELGYRIGIHDFKYQTINLSLTCHISDFKVNGIVTD
jgi:hypothetical protein